MLESSLKYLKQKNINVSPLFCIMIVVLISRILFYKTLVPYNIYPDSNSYIGFPFKCMLSFQFISGRTPVYPLIIRICYFIAGENHFLNLVVILQAIVSFASVFYFYKICCLLVSNIKLVYFFTVLYGLTPSVAGWDNNILTESFALSGAVFFIYIVLSYIKKPSFKLGVTAIILTFILTFLRPTFLLFDVLLFCFWVIRLLFRKQERKLLMSLIICSLTVFIFILGYCHIFKQTHGIFSISDPIPRQNLIVCIERGYYKSSSNKDFVYFIDYELKRHNNDSWSTMSSVLNKFGNKKIMDLTQECISKNKIKYTKDLIKLAVNLSDKTFPGYHQSKEYQRGFKFLFSSFVKISENIFAIFKVSHVYLISILELIVSIILFAKKKLISWIHLGILIFVTSIFITTLIGTCSEYPRTMICVLPFMYLSLALFFDWIFLCNGVERKNVQNV